MRNPQNKMMVHWRLAMGMLGIASILGMLGCRPTEGAQVILPVDSCAQRNLTWVNGSCLLDTAAILANHNLSGMMVMLTATTLQETHCQQEIPESYHAFLGALVPYFALANLGEEWEVGCTHQMVEFVADPDSTQGTANLVLRQGFKYPPSRQLVYFGWNDHIALLTYHKGGIARSTHILIFRTERGRVIDFWCGVTNAPASTKEAILATLGENMYLPWGLNTDIIYL